MEYFDGNDFAWFGDERPVADCSGDAEGLTGNLDQFEVSNVEQGQE